MPSRRELTERCQREVRGAIVSAFGAPPIDGLGTTGGFKLIIEDRGNLGFADLQRISDRIVERGNSTPGLQGLFNSSRANTPWLYLDIDRTKCVALGVPISELFNTLQVYLGSYYVNNFNEFGRSWQVNIQADQSFRGDARDIRQLQVRNNQGQMIKLATLMDVRNTSGPVMGMRYNMYSATAITGNPAPGTSSGEAIRLLQEIAEQELPRSMAFDWTELAFMQLQAGNTATGVFGLAVVFVFLVLAAQYESWKLPLAVILVVPMCLLCSLVGVSLAHMDVSLFTQIGFVVLVGLASKNAILIVEFAKQSQESGVSRREATLQACRLRLRPILMTSFAFIFGVVPLVLAEGAGSEMRRSLGTAVFGGMLGVTLFGIFLTPVFYYVIQRFGAAPPQQTHSRFARVDSSSWRWRRRSRNNTLAAHQEGSLPRVSSLEFEQEIEDQPDVCRGVLAVLFAARPVAGGQPKQGQAKEKAPLAGAQDRGAKKTYDPSDRYETREIEGWTVLVNKRFLAKQARLAKQTLALLREQFQQIVERVPRGAVKKLRTIHFWVEENEPHHPCMTYHPNPEWLRAKRHEPRKGSLRGVVQRSQLPQVDSRATVDGSSRAVSRISSSVPQTGLR